MASKREFLFRLIILSELIATVLCTGGAELLQNFQKWNEVPTEVYLGLLTDKAEVERVKLINGTCFQYEPHEFERCKYYSDCCAMTAARPMEQLAAGTYSCHSGYYIVDKCPANTQNRELKSQCEDRAESDLSLTRWPVRGILNQVTYKNVFCAICNGVDPTRQLNLQENQRIRYYGENPPSNVSTIEWWAVKVFCPQLNIESYLNNTPSHQQLIVMTNKFCKIVYYPPKSPDLCWEAVRTCPDNADPEIRRLCEEGPANYINITTSKTIYRNQFCAICHGENNSDATQPNDLLSKASSMSWQGDKMAANLVFDNGMLRLLASLRPKLQPRYVDEEYNNRNDFTTFEQKNSLLCSFFMDYSYDFCDEELFVTPFRAPLPIWDIGSLACFSQYHKVCDLFVVSDNSKAPECTTPGCGLDKVLDPATLKCIGVSGYEENKLSKILDHNWHSEVICSYQSQCRAAELGLVKSEELNCYCDKFCIYFNDCCADAPFQATEQTKLPSETYKCYRDDSDISSSASEDYFFWGVMQIDRCPFWSDDAELKTKCEQGPDLNWWEVSDFGILNTPVTDLKTGLRYRNMYCAYCHGVREELKFWRVDVGCGHLMNGPCRTPPWNINWELRENPTPEKLNSSGCRVKQWLPPEDGLSFRTCRYISRNRMVSTCPQEYEDWRVAKLCESGPASFVYEGGHLNQMVTSLQNYFQNRYIIYPFGYFMDNILDRTFRNGYCASCNSAAWLGCKVKKSFLKKEGGNDSTHKYIQYRGSVSPYMFVFRTNLNKRTCQFYSDGFVIIPTSETGLDTCINLGDSLKSCDCYSVYDFLTASCVKLNHTDIKCQSQNQSYQSPTISGYTRQFCNIDVFSFRNSCHHSNPTQTETNFYDLQAPYTPRSPCDNSSSPMACFPPSNETGCLESLSFFVTSSGLVATQKSLKTVILNAVAIAYQSTVFVFHIEIDEIEMVAGLDLIFGLVADASKATCSKFSLANDSFHSFLICPDKSIMHKETSMIYHDYHLRQNETYICTEYLDVVFKFEVYHYVLCGMSAIFIIAYVINYFIKENRSLTGNFFVSQLLTLLAALACYCLMTEANTSELGCKLVATLVQYFFLSVHAWTNVLAIWMFKGISAIRVVRRSGRKVFAMYATYAWISPLPFVMLSLILDAYPVNKLYPVFSETFCFLASGWIRVLVFTGPIYVQILVDIGLCIYASVLIARSGAGLTSSKSKEQLKLKVISVVKLLLIFGTQWFLLFFTEINSPLTKYLWTALNVLVTLQGVFIVLSQAVNRKNIAKLSQLGAKTASNNNNTSSTSGRPLKQSTSET